MPDIQTAFRQALATTLNDWDDEGVAAPVQPVRTKTPSDILGDLTVYQARELYDHLKKIFGG